MAGGSGTRLWPLSRRSRPKQLLRIINGRSLLYESFSRLRAFLPPQDIYVIALAEHLPAIAAELPEIPRENLIGEPTGRDTANAIALAAAILHRRDAETVMGVFTADHLIRPVDAFVQTVRRGYAAAVEVSDALVAFGIKPTEPNAGLGYVQRGEPAGPGVWAAQSFKEKPDLETARRYVACGEYYWNAGMFGWRTATILRELETHLPQSHAAARRLAELWGGEGAEAAAAEIYAGLQRISIDYAVMEKSKRVLVVEMPVEWLDVGSWTALAKVLDADPAGNVKALERAVQLSSVGNVLVCEENHLIATLGVKDLVIIHSPDATLVCHKDEVQRIKDLVAEVEREHGEIFS